MFIKLKASPTLFLILYAINLLNTPVIAQVTQINSSSLNTTNASLPQATVTNGTQANQAQSNHIPINNSSSSLNSSTNTNNATASSSNSSSIHNNDGSVPLDIKITTPLSILGALLIISGVPMNFWGGRNRWSSYFLTGAYIAALIVMIPILKFGVIEQDHPPTRVIEGVFVLICLLSAIGAGAVSVIFWKGTRFLVGAAGGFAISLFVLSLKSNSLIPALGLRWVVILGSVTIGFVLATIPTLAIHVTLFATAAMGAAAVVLGIDCFTTGGLKEFWLYIVGFGGLFPELTYFTLTVTMQAELGLMGGLFVMGAAVQWRLLEYIKKKIDELRQLDVERGLQEDAAAYRQSMALDADLSLWEKRHGDEADARTMVTSPTNQCHSRKNSQFSLAPLTSLACVVPRVAYDDVPCHPNEQLPMIDGGFDLGNSLDIAEEFSNQREKSTTEVLDAPQTAAIPARPSSNLQKNNQSQLEVPTPVASSINFDKSANDRRFSRPPGAPSSWATPIHISTLNSQKPVLNNGQSRPVSYHSLSAQPEETPWRNSRQKVTSVHTHRPISEHLPANRINDFKSQIDTKRHSEVPSRVIVGSYQPPAATSNLQPRRESKTMTVEELDQRHKQAMKNLQLHVADKTNNPADRKPTKEQHRRQSAKGLNPDTSAYPSTRNHERRKSSDLLMGRNSTQHQEPSYDHSNKQYSAPQAPNNRQNMDSRKSQAAKGWLDY